LKLEAHVNHWGPKASMVLAARLQGSGRGLLREQAAGVKYVDTAAGSMQ
jgi:hypothetical protein